MRLIPPRWKYVLVILILPIHLGPPISLQVRLGLEVLVHILYNNHILLCPIVFTSSLVRPAKILFFRSWTVPAVKGQNGYIR